MSVEAMRWALRVRTGSQGRKCVLMCLADDADSSGECWPSIGLIAARAECSERTVQRHLDALEELGVLTRHRRRRKSGNWSTYQYRLRLDRPPDSLSGGAPADVPVPSSATPQPSDPETRPTARQTPSDAPSEAPRGPADDQVAAVACVPPDILTAGQNVASPPDTRVASPHDTAVSGQNHQGYPPEKPSLPRAPAPARETPPAGGREADTGRQPSDLLLRVAAELDPAKRARLLAEPDTVRHRLEVALHGCVAVGWTPTALVAEIAGAKLDGAVSPARVLLARAAPLAAASPRTGRPRSELDQRLAALPGDTRRDVIARALTDATTAGGGRLDLAVRDHLLDAYARDAFESAPAGVPA